MTAALLLLKSNIPPDVVAISNQSLSTNVFSPEIATCGYRLTTAGIAEAEQGLGYSTLEEWLDNEANAGLYEVRVTVNSGSLTSGTSGSWLSLASTRTWELTRSILGSASCNITVEIRLASSGVVVDSATVSLGATVQDFS